MKKRGKTNAKGSTLVDWAPFQLLIAPSSNLGTIVTLTGDFFYLLFFPYFSFIRLRR